MKKLIIVLIFVPILIGCNMNIQQSNYDNYEDAVKMIEKGWIPYDIPIESTDIYEIHDLDTNRSNGSFKIPTEKIYEFSYELQKIDKSVINDILFVESNKFVKEDIKKKIKIQDFTIGIKDYTIYAVNDAGQVYYFMNAK